MKRASRRNRRGARPSPAARRAAAPARARLLAHPALWSALAALVLYAPSFGYGFVWDDHQLIEQNPLLRSVAGLRHALVSDFWVTSGAGASGLWRPLISFSYWLEGTLSHWTPGPFHAMNALAHAAVSGLTAALALAAGAPAWVAGLAGLWFAAMPAHVESVAWISGRTDVYCAGFFLLALLLDRRARARGRRWPGVGAPLALALALLAKESALPFVAVVAAAEWTGARGRRLDLRDSARWLLPYAVVTLAHLGLHAAWVSAPQPAGAAALAAQGVGPKAVALMFPAYLSFAWPWMTHTPAVTLEATRAGGAALAGALALHLALVAALAVLLARRAVAALPLALFWLTLLPTLAVNLTHGYLLFAERFFYLPSAGLAWAAAMGVAALRARPALQRAAGGALGALALGSALAVTPLLSQWQSDAELFRAMASASPRNYMARTQWARMLALHGRDAEAARELEAAAALDPGRPEVASIRAILHYHHGEWGGTLIESERAIALGSTQNEPRLLRATALLGLGRSDEAGRALAEMRARTPASPAVQSLWGQYLLQAGRAAEAYPVLERAVRLLPPDADVTYALGLAAAGAGRAAAAREAFERTVRLNPAHYDAWLNLAEAGVALGDRAGARAALVRAAALPQARDGRAAEALGRLGTGAP